MLAQSTFFPCPKCNEIIASDSSKCKYCNQPVDAVAAQAAASLQERINQACNDASNVRNVAGFMWIGFAIQFINALMGRLVFIGMLVAVPVMLISWQLKYGSIKSDDVDFRTAKRNRNIALLLMLPVPVVIVALVMILAAS